MDYLERAKRFRDQAEECRQLAELAVSDSVRRTYASVARSYDLMADDLDALANHQLTSHREAG